MKGLAFDLGSNTGVASFTDAKLTHVQLLKLKSDYFGTTLTSFKKALYKLLKTDPDWLAYEEVMVKNKYHAEIHFGMVGLLAMAAHHRLIPLVGINTMTMKKQVVGTGKAKKEQVVAEVLQRYPHLRSAELNHDMADAICVGLTAISMMELPEEEHQDGNQHEQAGLHLQQDGNRVPL